MASNVELPPQFQQTFEDVDKLLSQPEKTNIIQSMKEIYPDKLGGLDDEDFFELQRALFKIGAITNDLSLIPKITANAEKKEEIQAIIDKCEPLEMKEFVGREADVQIIVKMLTNKRLCVPGINFFGESGVGKTTLAQEIAKSLKDFQLITIDLRGILEMGNVYFHVLDGFKLPIWDKDISRFFSHLKTLKEKTLLILDNVEQLHGLPSEKETESQKAEFFDFLLEIVTSTACKSGDLKLLLTSRERLDDAKLRKRLLSDHKVQPFDDKVSKRFLSRDEKQIPGISKEDEEANMQEIVKLCKNIPYLLQCAKQMLREDSSLSEVLKRLKSQLEKKVPEEYACMAEQFESIPEHLKQLAVKLSHLQQPFSISTAMKIGDIELNYNASIDLELLAVHKVLSKVDGKKLKYDIHAQFKDFVKKYLCKAQLQYKEALQEGEKQFFTHFAGKMSKLAPNFDEDFVGTYSKLEGNRANFELAIDISKKRGDEVFDVLLHCDNHNEAALMGLLLEALKDTNERKILYSQWAENAERSGKWLISAQLRCWQALQGADMEGTRDANEALRIAKGSLKKAEQQPQQPQEQLKAAKSLFLYASGKIKWLHASKSQDSKEKKDEIQEGISNLKKSLRLSEDATKGQASTMKARIINLIGNCYMELNDPSTAETYFLRALEMKRKLVGSDNHWEIPKYYNQIAQVHVRRGMNMVKSLIKFWYKTKIDAEYNAAVECSERALKLQDDLGVSDTEHTATFQRDLANSLIGIGDYDKALLYASKCYENRLKRLGKHPETARILYLTGIIHEWRKDIESARKSYEQAFEMEEALPEYNHSFVRTKIRKRLEAMYKKLKLKDKIAELKERFKDIEERENEISQCTSDDSEASDVSSVDLDDLIDPSEELHEHERTEEGTYQKPLSVTLHFPETEHQLIPEKNLLCKKYLEENEPRQANAEFQNNSEISEKQHSGHWKDDPDSSDVYRMKSNPRGLMVIINIQKFDVDPTLENREELMKELTERKGSERDVDKLTDLFSGKLNFKVCTIIDKPRIVLLRELRSFAEDSAYKDYDCLTVCIMSHGKDDKFYAYDGNTVKVSAVYNMFSNSRCVVFRSKPKLFFIQACRGQRGSGKVVMDGMDRASVESSAQHPPAESKDLDMADMLIAYSSFEDYISYRHAKEGSCFIQSLVRFFREYADSEHVEEILTRVKKEVHGLVQETSQGRTQVPAPVSTLLKKLYFWPGMDFNK